VRKAQLAPQGLQEAQALLQALAHNKELQGLQEAQSLQPALLQGQTRSRPS
jgi:hypothetical protein